MKLIFIVLWAFLVTHPAAAQKAVFDVKHYESVVSNAAVRNAAETTHQQYLGKISTDINNLNTNAGAVVIAQDMIYRSLSNVNSALRDGLEVKYMAFIISDINSYILQALELAKEDPFLLLFARDMTTELRQRSISLVSEVSGFALKDGGNILADYGARDELLHKVVTQLQIMDGLAYGIWKAMFWARQGGIIKSLNPFRDFINRDREFIARIITNAKYLK